MSRYIDADKLKETWYTAHNITEDDRGAIFVGYSEVPRFIDNAPSADVRENVKGEWEEIEVIPKAYDIAGVKTWASIMMCNQCRFLTWAIEGHFGYSFCPNCGADMRGDNNEY